MEANIRGSFEKLGSDVVYVQKFPWGGHNEVDWEKILRRPDPDFKDFEAIKARVKVADKVAYSAFVGQVSVQYRSSSYDGCYVIGISYEYGDIFNVEFEEGRYFSPTEHFYGGPQAVIGNEVARGVFGENINPIGKYVKIKGRKYQVIGVIQKEGNDLVNPIDFDDAVLLSINNTRNFASVDFGAMIVAKASENISINQLEDELTSVLRSNRRLKPQQEDNFSLNQLSIISNVFDSIFGVMNISGFIIGGFSMLIGMFSVANIMFVSVKERTRLIGIKKAIGAKSYMILLEFLVEAIILCVIGGAIGLGLVLLTVIGATNAVDFEFFLSSQNIIIGTIVSVATGIIAGIIPAIQAARMVPVEAIRA